MLWPPMRFHTPSPEPRAFGLKASEVLLRLAMPLIVVVAWGLASRHGTVISRFLASPWQAASTLAELVASGELVAHAAASLSRVALGLAAATAFAVPVGIAIAWWRPAELALSPLLEFLRPIPIAAWVPLSVLIFGIGEVPARVLIFLGAIHPIILNTALGVRSVDTLYVRAARMLGARQRDVVRRVLIPSALPSVLTGIRLGLGIAWWVVIVAELLAVRSGLGYMMVMAMALLRSDIMIAGIITIGVIGLLLNRLALWLEAVATPWRHA